MGPMGPWGSWDHMGLFVKKELQGFELSPPYKPDCFDFSIFPISGFLDMRKLFPGTSQDFNVGVLNSMLFNVDNC